MESTPKFKTEKFLCFRLGEEEYGLPILTVREIVGMMEYAEVPQTHSYVKGIINLRGRIVPMIDLRLKFNMENRDYTERTCIIIIEYKSGEKLIYMGLVVDSVTEVSVFDEGTIERTPDFVQTDVEQSYITGIGKTGEKVKILLDVKRLFTQMQLLV